MAGREQPYDPYIPSGNAGSTQHQGGDGRTAALQAKINETVGIMKQNLTNTDERGVKINDLQGKTHRLQNESYNFRTSAKKVKRQMCISNMKWWFVLIGVVIVVIIIAVAVAETKKKH